MLFEWDEGKDAINRRKHGISFTTASLVFCDPFSVSRKDDYDGGEERWQIIGHIQGVPMILVVYTTRDQEGEQKIRIISARRATAQERREYEDGTWFS